MIRAVAARHGLCEGLLFTWRRQAREALLALVPQSPVFMPVQTVGPTGTAMLPIEELPRSASASRSVGAPGLIEIELGNGQQVRVDRDVNLPALRRVLAALSG